MFWKQYWQALLYSIILPPAPIIYYFLTIFNEHFSDKKITLPGFLGTLTAWTLFALGFVSVGELCTTASGTHNRC
jgi:hypothetical protein